MVKTGIYQPIFFVGVPRSGTTVVFETFSRHENLGYPTNYTRKFPKWPVMGLLFFFFNRRSLYLMGKMEKHGGVPLGNKLRPKIAEAYSFWDYYTRTNFSRNYLGQQVCGETARVRVSRAVNSLLKWQKKPRFCSKLTGPPRIEYLKSIFPDAKFVHIVRDGRAVVNSLLNVSFWRKKGGLDRPYWKPGLPGEYVNMWKDFNRDSAILAALQWRNIIEVAHCERRQLGSEQYLEIRYEDFITAPHELLQTLYKFCNLSDSKRAHTFLDYNPVSAGMNSKYKKDLSPDTIASITDVMQPVLTKLRYK